MLSEIGAHLLMFQEKFVYFHFHRLDKCSFFLILRAQGGTKVIVTLLQSVWICIIITTSQSELIYTQLFCTSRQRISYKSGSPRLTDVVNSDIQGIPEDPLFTYTEKGMMHLLAACFVEHWFTERKISTKSRRKMVTCEGKNVWSFHRGLILVHLHIS